MRGRPLNFCWNEKVIVTRKSIVKPCSLIFAKVKRKFKIVRIGQFQCRIYERLPECAILPYKMRIEALRKSET